MGKVRAKTLGDQEAEQKERDEAEKRRLAKIEAAKKEGKAKKNAAPHVSETQAPVILNGISPDARDEKPEPKKEMVKKGSAKPSRSANYKKAVSLIEKRKTYSLSQALEILEKAHMAKFDETVELHINTIGSLSGSMQLPHGTGKVTRVAILAPSKDAAEAEALLKKIEAGKIDFDVLVATPDAMPRLAKVARILGPRGLMPNPKNGTVTTKPEEVAKQYAGGHMTYKTESKAPVLHLSVGKLSFGKEKLEENITTAFKTVQTKNMKKIVLKSTMSPAIRVQV